MHWVARQNKLETPKEKDEVNKREVHDCDVRTRDQTSFAGKFIGNRIKKRRKPRVKSVTLKLYVESEKADIAYMKNTPHVPLRQITEEKIRGKELRVV